ncbi:MULTISPECIES: bifunctional D-glycero-beta-D-manno-heptose-7-phosphate kinase/D-glycero-beta-D-manno-heptose 1-phosphate adenylyltransferase HldE [unclassified Gilliamella]|uniref:bifunctional D-glycero-beta-D-manno-heptose-7-phosphate kinase/D-glycero-beta-D-manno-heptose 1-phosphate adenylyltransferase HldE n=1 Tax=unclassified Gilliamella TaxID=2685620 RepID=UPI00226ADF48|nr:MULTISPECIES: bifunctional D-glycero-beta-D-manno-heptose-7-phosphate kinase/D-glycero-beta-D-manno-heptose 1-phosphate adenylyltransferase HldE [unclassified Gilliamella]MCX8641478.1 bifunctional D-glycero-beta-D-manno-heptose-7-phosphate kinase/D-glycero-beta-D-manno-heptose 1-phosphate adenylyltransferase HldE [Gilliamella sp. B3835]MCX8707588.1 bifunctional D-glycero-beta-D-manno-heptose-7-phosphate kinase/D-glycero-beta-D-manno-heptose 1-phosphate adenylyltransferase HldE [Gilliamella sp.
MKTSLPDFSQANVLVVGDIMLDRYWYGGTNRISPEAPVPVVKIDALEERPGGAANVAMNITSLSGNVRLIGLTGIDEAAKILDEELSKHHVHCDFVAVSTHPTITKLRVLSRNQQLIRIDFEEGFDKVDASPILERIQTALTTHKVLVLSDYAKGALSSVQKMIDLANQANVPILVDPKGTDFERYRGATLLTPNMSEFEAVVGQCDSEQEIVEKGLALIKKYQLKALLVTRSEKGMTLLQLDKPTYHLPTQAKEVFDVTGAGDTVIATLAAALASGQSLEDSCYLANAAAGVVVGKLGTSTVSQVELENAIRARKDNGFGVMTEDELKEEVKKARQRGEKIVMTNGCFDILHAGHVSYLANARKLGDRLIVAVNSDASVKQLKGESRPINPLMQRMIVLGALDSVDWVVPFEEQTPQRLIANILPDVLVKGGDYKPEDIAGGKEVIDAGGIVKVLNFEDGCSTTNIINKIKSR